MSSIAPAYEALHSESGSTSQSPRRRESQLSRETVEQSTVPPTSHLSTRIHFSRFWTSWEWEFAACFLALMVPIIVFATLYPHSGQPLPQWPFKVSINSLLSVYALVLKATIGFILTSCIGQLQWAWFSETRPLTDMLLFDSATRGADGALSLIWRQRFRQPLTVLGCIVMVLAVAVDPFVQQLVRPVDCSVELSGGDTAATLSRANFFEDSIFQGHSNTTEEAGVDSAEKVIQNVLYDAIFTPGKGPPWKCSTGNCTFQDVYSTIGICYSCQDVSADVVINITCSHPNSSYASHHPESSLDCPANSDFTVESTYTFENAGEYYYSTNPGEYIRLGTKMNTSALGFNDIVVADAFAVERPGLLLGVDGDDLLFGFLIGATANSSGRGRIDWTTSDDSACNSDDRKGSWACQGYGAATCYLRPCVQEYNATISAGILEEHLVTSSSDTAWGTVYDPDGSRRYFALLDTHCSAGNQTFLNRESSVGRRWLPFNFSFTEADAERDGYGYHLPNDVTSLIDNDCLYLLSATGIMGSTHWYLSGSVQPNGLVMTDDPRTIGLSSFEGPEFVRSIYNWGHTDFERVQSVIANISDSLTTFIRANGGSSIVLDRTNFSKDVQGKAYHYATCLQVQWIWLSFPASLAVLTTLFFLMVVRATRRKGSSVWKASPLAWILRAEAPGNKIFSASHGSCERMKERSTQIAVRLLEEHLDGPHIRMADLKDPNLL